LNNFKNFLFFAISLHARGGKPKLTNVKYAFGDNGKLIFILIKVQNISSIGCIHG
jgi:hypothetical protein